MKIHPSIYFYVWYITSCFFRFVSDTGQPPSCPEIIDGGNTEWITCNMHLGKCVIFFWMVHPQTQWNIKLTPPLVLCNCLESFYWWFIVSYIVPVHWDGVVGHQGEFLPCHIQFKTFHKRKRDIQLILYPGNLVTRSLFCIGIWVVSLLGAHRINPKRTYHLLPVTKFIFDKIFFKLEMVVWFSLFCYDWNAELQDNIQLVHCLLMYMLVSSTFYW